MNLSSSLEGVNGLIAPPDEKAALQNRYHVALQFLPRTPITPSRHGLLKIVAHGHSRVACKLQAKPLPHMSHNRCNERGPIRSLSLDAVKPALVRMSVDNNVFLVRGNGRLARPRLPHSLSTLSIKFVNALSENPRRNRTRMATSW